MATVLTIDIDADAEGLRLIAVGEIDLSNIVAFRRALTEAVAEASRRETPLVVDLAAVAYLDSVAITVLFACAGHIATIVAPSLLMTTLRVSGLAEVVDVVVASGI